LAEIVNWEELTKISVNNVLEVSPGNHPKEKIFLYPHHVELEESARAVFDLHQGLQGNVEFLLRPGEEKVAPVGNFTLDHQVLPQQHARRREFLDRPRITERKRNFFHV
jgi:hypothetical protein